MAAEAGAEIVAGTSLKAALDLDWDNPQRRQEALVRVLKALEAVEMYLDGATTEAKGSVDIARQIESQDVEIEGERRSYGVGWRRIVGYR